MEIKLVLKLPDMAAVGRPRAPSRSLPSARRQSWTVGGAGWWQLCRPWVANLGAPQHSYIRLTLKLPCTGQTLTHEPLVPAGPRARSLGGRTVLAPVGMDCFNAFIAQ